MDIYNGGAPPDPPRPAKPPMPTQPPPEPPAVRWLRTPRPSAPVGVWRYGHQPRGPVDPDRTPTRQLAVGAAVSLLACWLLWSVLFNGYLGDWWFWPLTAVIPDSWIGPTTEFIVLSYLYYAAVLGGMVVFFGRMGRWPELFRRIRARVRQHAPQRPAVLPPESDPACWPELRSAGAADAAQRLSHDLMSGRLTDVDYLRIHHAWMNRPRDEFVRAVLKSGAASFPHGSGKRDIARSAAHDLMLSQVRLGLAVDSDPNPAEYRGLGMALSPSLLATSAVAAGPSQSSSRVVRAVVESVCLQALGGSASLVYITSQRNTGPDDQFDAIVRVGGDTSTGIDLYSGIEDPYEAAAMLAEALVGDMESLPGGDSRQAGNTLAQLVVPFHAVHGRLPDASELRDLLDGDGSAVESLRTALRGVPALSHQARELEAYERRSDAATAAALASRSALLDRPAVSRIFSAGRLVSMQQLVESPARIRIELPERSHVEASRILARLLLAQFTDRAAARTTRNALAFLVLEGAEQTVTPVFLRSLQNLTSRNAGVLLTVQTLDDVHERLRQSLLGAVGCRFVCSGVSPWDAGHFSDSWGTEWVESRIVTDRQLVAHEPLTRVIHGLRKLVTGKHVTAQSVTVRREQRQRWSPSSLSEIPPQHAVVSLSSTDGKRTPPVLTDLSR